MTNRFAVVWPAPTAGLDSELLWAAVGDLIAGLPAVQTRCQELHDPEGLHLSVMALGEVVRAIGHADALREGRK